MLEADRAVHRGGQLVDRGDALLGIDEQPLPVERHDLDHQRLDVRGDRALRVDAVAAAGTGRAGAC